MNPQTFACPVDGTLFKTRVNLRRHVTFVHNLHITVCEICDVYIEDTPDVKKQHKYKHFTNHWKQEHIPPRHFLLAYWFENRKRIRNDITPLNGTIYWRCYSELPRTAFAELLRQLSSDVPSFEKFSDIHLPI